MPIVCQVTRNGYIESIHVAYAVVVDEQGKIVFSTGDPGYVTCVRSSLKPFQAVAAVAAGATEAAGFVSRELALMCASHNGEPVHVETVQGMLKKLGYSPELYECGSHPPYHQSTAETLIRKRQPAQPLHNNCSGKHAGMLALARHLGVDPHGYTRLQHPVQKHILRQVERFSGIREFPLGIDGCSAPTPFLPLVTVAGMFQKLAGGKYPELNVLYNAMVGHPYLVGGEKRFDTDFMTALKGRAVTKIGGEAIRGLGIRKPDGEIVGMALKIVDGNTRADSVATLAVLDHLRLLTTAEDTALGTLRTVKLMNHRRIHVGDISARIES